MTWPIGVGWSQGTLAAHGIFPLESVTIQTKLWRIPYGSGWGRNLQQSSKKARCVLRAALDVGITWRDRCDIGLSWDFLIWDLLFQVLCTFLRLHTLPVPSVHLRITMDILVQVFAYGLALVWSMRYSLFLTDFSACPANVPSHLAFLTFDIFMY